jgi:DNA-binding NarL/FixJ family response regulator
MKSIQVIIVEDHPIVVEGIERLLRTDPRIKILARVRTLAEFNALPMHFHPNVILLDLRLPDSRGAEAITIARRACPEARVIVLTASTEVTPAHARKHGADGFIDKQVASDRILPTILSFFPSTGVQRPEPKLTPRDGDVARLAADGLTNAEIAKALHVSQNTVKTHLARVLDKLGLRHRTELARHWRPAE